MKSNATSHQLSTDLVEIKVKKDWKSGFWSPCTGYRASQISDYTPKKFNTDTKNDGLKKKVSPFKHGYFGYLCLVSRGEAFQHLFFSPVCPHGK